MYLVIDTTTKYFTLAVGDGSRVIDSKVLKGRKHSERIIPAIEDLLKKNDFTFKDIKAIGATAGPGSFTGIRVGLSCAVTMAQVLDIPLYPLSLLDIAGRESSHPVIKAFGKKYYSADYDSSGKRKGDYKIIDSREKKKIGAKSVKAQPGQLLKEVEGFVNRNEEGKWTDIEPLYLMETKYIAKNG